MTDYKPGDRLRVAFEGMVDEYGHLCTSAQGLAFSFLPIGYLRHAVSVERLPDPEPDWQPGDVVRAADGHTYARTRNDSSYVWVWLDYAPNARVNYLDDEVTRPLVPLVRGGKPWGET